MQEQAQLAVRRFLERARRQMRSQDEMAGLVSRLGYPVKRSAIGHWMTGRVERVPAWVIFALAERLQLPLDDFVTENRSLANRVSLLEALVFDLTNQKQATERPVTSNDKQE